MRLWLVTLLVWLTLIPIASADVRTPATHPLPAISLAAPGDLTQVGEIVVIEGDSSVVTDMGGGSFGITSEQMQAIANKFYMVYPDEFDGLAVFTTFPDEQQGGFAYALILDSGFGGIGLTGGYSPTQFGSQGRLISFINMNDTAQYGTMDEGDGLFHSVFGQEFGHTWLSFMQFYDSVSGQPSGELLGRDNAHWSAFFNSGGSVMDGAQYTDNGDGTFTAGPNSVHYGPLDLYAMGVYAPEEVTDLFVIRNARYQDNGQLVGAADIVNAGRVLTGQRHDFTVADIVAIHGPRMPAHDAENEDFRVAFILVTRPGETAAMVADRIAKLEVGRLAWEKKHRDWTFRRSTMCTDVTAYCPLAFAEIVDTAVSEEPGESNGNGIIEPGEKVRLDVTFRNEGTRAATTAQVSLSSDSPGVVLPAEPVTIPEIGIESTVTHPFLIEIEGDACGAEIEVNLEATIETRTWRGTARFRPGLIENPAEPFATPAGWLGNFEGRDSAVQGQWEHGVPDATFFAGRMLQPESGAGGAGDAAWFTGLGGDWDGDEVIGATTLTSGVYDLDGLYEPMLRYKVWYLALDRVGPTLQSAAEPHLMVEASDDDGVTWHLIDEVSGDPLRWQEREIPLAPHIQSTASVRFRFTAFDDKDADLEGRIVEVGIDDVAVVSLSTICRDGPPGGGCCSAHKSPPIGELALFLLAVAIAALRRTWRVSGQSGAGAGG